MRGDRISVGPKPTTTKPRQVLRFRGCLEVIDVDSECGPVAGVAVVVFLFPAIFFALDPKLVVALFPGVRFHRGTGFGGVECSWWT